MWRRQRLEGVPREETQGKVEEIQGKLGLRRQVAEAGGGGGKPTLHLPQWNVGSKTDFS